jgi:type I restriction enzyme M protein
LELLGLERAISFLRPGGRLGIVLPDSVFSADSASFVREWLRGKVKVRGLVSLPTETFCPFGANVKTGILFARKWKPGETTNAPYQVCLLKVESVGYDSTGRPKGDGDLGEAAAEFEQFINANGW